MIIVFFGQEAAVHALKRVLRDTFDANGRPMVAVHYKDAEQRLRGVDDCVTFVYDRDYTPSWRQDTLTLMAHKMNRDWEERHGQKRSRHDQDSSDR